MNSLVVAGILATGLMLGAREAPTVAVGDPAPDFEGEWLGHEDDSGKLSDLRGRVVLMEFWRTW